MMILRTGSAIPFSNIDPAVNLLPISYVPDLLTPEWQRRHLSIILFPLSGSINIIESNVTGD